MSYCLVRDNDSHWYVICSAEREEFYKWVIEQERTLPHLESMKDFSACRISSPELIIFDRYTDLSKQENDHTLINQEWEEVVC